MQLSSDQLAYLARLSKTPDGRFLLSLLEARLVERDGKLRTATGEEVFRAQGRAAELADLIRDITDAESKLTRNSRSTHQSTPVLA